MARARKLRQREVALLIESSNAYARGLLQGVIHYVREHQLWILHLKEQGRREDPPAWLEQWHGDGIIARIETDVIARAVARARCPTIDVSAARFLPDLSWVETDDALIAKLAIEHLHGRGFRHYAFCGDARFNWSRWREEEFSAQVRALGFDCEIYQAVVSPEDPDAQGDSIAKWVASLPKPVGIMACYDVRGRQILEACRRAGITVPYEVAVIGVDNDELLCELSIPPLTSVITNPQRAGYQAAALLDRLMNGYRPKPSLHRIPPLGVASRQSTDILAINDRDVTRALHFIRENACRGINVEDVLAAVPLSRRVLEQRFQKLLGHSPREEIQQVRLDRVRQLLTETDLRLFEIAERTGFEHVEYLSVMFRREVKMTPSQYRAKAKG